MYDNKVLPLPNPNYLTTYLRGIPCQFGFSEFAFEQLKKQFQDLPRINRQVAILFDEMKVREAIKYDKTLMRFFGFIDYGEFNSETVKKKTDNLQADHALVFMVRTLDGKTVITFYPVIY